MNSVSLDEGGQGSWLKDPPLAFQLALMWRRFGIRGKSAASRLIGRSIGRGMRASVRLASGARLAIDPSNLDIYVSIAANGGYWDEHITRTLARVVQPGDNVYDIGANAGAISVDIAWRFKNQIKLIAIEPIPSLAAQLTLSARINGLADTIEVHEFMLGDQEGEAILHVPSHAIHASVVAREAGARPLPRKVHRLDDLVNEGKLPTPTVIKIDVEGAEFTVFRGAGETFKRNPPVILFEADENMNRFGYTRADLLAFLREAHAGYKFYYITKKDATLRPATNESELLNDDTGNLLAVPAGRDVALG
jgi:FkbM family methyltransferase